MPKNIWLYWTIEVFQSSWKSHKKLGNFFVSKNFHKSPNLVTLDCKHWAKKRFTVSIPGRPFWGRWRWLWRRHVLRRAHDGRTEVGQPAPHPKASSQPRPLGVGEYNVWCFCEIFLLPPSAGNNAQIKTWHKRNINKIIEWKKAYLIFLYVAYLSRLS